ncbi:putative Fe-Mo cluster-binding protein, NifX family [Halapricum desulfuricans]|uniref:Putative Fe-Mo cluster-binding protein, NifX family n=1 Tax=Halapricum desulfuricans TaxID=2841257 RepID=A0A897N9J8_9EURY|nr:putative Fe-Mo cluster-binding protein, NifX family [Halapricum desulfuricans]
MPSLDDGRFDADVSPHFGRAPNYTVYDTEVGTLEVHGNDGRHHGGNRSPPEIIASTGADALVCGNLGQKAVERFESMDIDVFRGASGTVEDAVEQLQTGELEEAVPDGTNCSGDGHGDGHGHDHGDGHGHSHDHGEGHDHGHGHDHGKGR